MKTLLTLFALALTASASVKEITVTGRLFEERGDFFGLDGEVPFMLRLDFDTEAVDWNPSSVIGQYYSELPLTLDFDGLHFETVGNWITVTSGDGPNWGFTFWSDEAFTANGFDVAQYGIYIQFNSFFPIVAPDDTLASVAEYDITSPASSERFYLINEAFPTGPGSERLLSMTSEGIDRLTVQDVPEPSTILLALLGGLCLNSCRIRCLI